jgi:lipopolysaccharide transport system ATP-binding protein
MSKPVIQVENLGKKYRLRHENRERYVALRDVIANGITAPFRWAKSHLGANGNATANSSSTEDFWALKDLNFEVQQGDVLGVIGRNGAGKSTLLKVLSRITEPTTGRIRIRGRVASLLEVGTGFHPELTGRENIFLNGAILGMRRAEIHRKFDEIVAFAEVEKFLDTPVKRYSSGMYVRLAFAVAAHLEPEILIIDEVLAVGDAAFQKKCLGKMGEVAKQGRTVLFVSHNMGVVSSLTQRCIYLQNGRVAASGPSREIVEMYLMKSLEARGEKLRDVSEFRRSRNPDAPVKVAAVGINGGARDSAELPAIGIGADFSIAIELEVAKPLHGALIDITLKNSHGERIALLFSWDRDFSLHLAPGRHTVTAQVRGLPLAPGNYFADIGLNQSVESVAYDVILDYPVFSIVNHGQVTHWLDRPWGVLHCDDVEWSQTTSNA